MTRATGIAIAAFVTLLASGGVHAQFTRPSSSTSGTKATARDAVAMTRQAMKTVSQARSAMTSVNFVPSQQAVPQQVQKAVSAYAPAMPVQTGYGLAYTPDQCEGYIRDAERRYNLPPYLLHAISLTESGTRGRPNPRAMNIGGRAYIAPNVATMEQVSIANWGRQNVDVGCMQISLKHHAARFKDWRALLNPQYNVEYAALYLTELYRELGSWTRAVGAYHSRTSWRGANYVCLVTRRYGQIFGDKRPGCGPNMEQMVRVMYGKVSWGNG